MFWQKKQKSFFDYFEEHAQAIHSSAELLKKLLSLNDSPKNPVELSKKIKDFEHAADLITHAVVKQMYTSSFILPLDREDILTMSKTLDDVIDYINEASQAFSEIYQLQKQTAFSEQFGDTILKSTEILKKTCNLVRYPSRNSSQILKNCVEIHRLENVGDEIKKEALKNLFAQLKTSAIDVPTFVAWNEIYRLLEIVTDKAEDCANVAEQIVMKYS